MEININLEPLKKVPGELERLLVSAKGTLATLKERIPSEVETLRGAVERFTNK